MQETLSLEVMPQTILELMHKVDTLRADISELKERSRTQTPEPMIGIDKACKILQRAKSTSVSGDIHTDSLVLQIYKKINHTMTSFNHILMSAVMRNGRHITPRPYGWRNSGTGTRHNC